MNKQMIVLIAFVACVFAMPASADTIEVRGEVVNLAGAHDDLMTETLMIAANTLSTLDRTIDENCLSYQTTPVYQEYRIYSCKGSTVDEDDGYYLEGWIGEPYVAIGGRADKLCELLVEFKDNDKKTLSTGAEWDLGGGFSLEARHIDVAGNTAWFF
jgi:hypothetical protein